MDRLISRLFYLLFFLTPLVFWSKSSELFEFNKMVLVYAFTAVTTAAWLTRCVLVKRFIFRRTALDIPLIFFLLAITLSTLFSIDIRTSLLGYYSRFHGGLLSYLSYSLLYWAFVSNMNHKKTLTACYSLLASAFLVSIYGILQHFGIDKDVWVQDVQNRIFSTLGQPNWLAAFLVALLPIIFSFQFSITKQFQNSKRVTGLKLVKILNYALSALFFTVLLFTKSRSGLLGFLVADLIFWTLTFWQIKRKALFAFLIHNSIFLILTLTVGTPWFKSVLSPTTKWVTLTDHRSPITSNAPALETGGTESGEIRKIVWKGAFELWKKYPILGTGPETFAYSYYETRPVEHNLVSEWDFLYNKAHNEYLNFAATTGTFGLAAYLVLVVSGIYQILNHRHQASNSKQSRNSNLFDNLQKQIGYSIWNLKFGILAGYASILVTNFFGFSVAPVALLFFVFPAFASTLAGESTEYRVQSVKTRLETRQKVVSIFVLCTLYFVLYRITVYWYSDLLYAKGKLYNDSEDFITGRGYLIKAVSLSPHEAIFWDELSQSSAGLEEVSLAVGESQKALDLSPRNLNLIKNRASLFIKISALNPDYLLEAKKITEYATALAPTDAKLLYNLALTTYRLGQTEAALGIFNKTIQMKPNYKNARLAKALILIDLGKIKEAKEELVYILEKIAPDDNLVKKELEKIN